MAAKIHHGYTIYTSYTNNMLSVINPKRLVVLFECFENLHTCSLVCVVVMVIHFLSDSKMVCAFHKRCKMVPEEELPITASHTTQSIWYYTHITYT